MAEILVQLQRMIEKRARKIDSVLDDLPKGKRWGDAGAKIGLLGFGTVGAVMERAAERLAKVGTEVQILQPRTLWPVLDETVAFVRECDRVYVIEHNAAGQLAHLVSGGGAPKERMVSILKYDGTPFRAVDLVDAILEKESATT
jgi:2-oxoglutarate ferredoxin oxidoreductase subunit alpha